MTSEAAAFAAEAQRSYEKDEFEQAIDLFELARVAFEKEGDRVKAAEMANNRSVALGQVNRYQAALEALEGTQEIFLEYGEMTKAAQAIGNQAAAYEGLGAWNKAETAYQEAADRFHQIGDKQNQHYTLQALSRVRLRQGRAMEAVSTMQDALDTGAKPNWRTRAIRKILSLPSRLIKP